MKNKKRALILVDYQNDFVEPSGSLYVQNAEQLKTYLIEKIKQAKAKGITCIATKDWHPQKHVSFAIWPVHSVINTWGAEMSIDEHLFDKVIKKGQYLDADSYSGFFDDKNRSNGLHEYLQAHNITDLEITGVATDICVSSTLQHAIELGYNIVLDLNGCCGVENVIRLQTIQPRLT